ncbi:MAG: 50S ribosomal protein L32 [Candidatus Kerfeldbacteria bacterium]|nr:50S ribosomal protein L32 [Candidatus Kerfeldbacteria bacterium]
MGLPAKRRTKQSKRERSAHFALVEANLTTCSHCKRQILPHRVCPYCGYYRGREVLKLEQLLGKKAKKRSAASKAKADEARAGTSS